MVGNVRCSIHDSSLPLKHFPNRDRTPVQLQSYSSVATLMPEITPTFVARQQNVSERFLTEGDFKVWCVPLMASHSHNCFVRLAPILVGARIDGPQYV